MSDRTPACTHYSNTHGERLWGEWARSEGVAMPVHTRTYQPKKVMSHQKAHKVPDTFATFQGAKNAVLTERSIRNTTLPGELCKPTQLLAFQLCWKSLLLLFFFLNNALSSPFYTILFLTLHRFKDTLWNSAQTSDFGLFSAKGMQNQTSWHQSCSKGPGS